MPNKKALIVVDMQNDYLWNRRKKMFSYNTPELVNTVNSLISEFSERGDDVIYVGQVFPNIITNKWFIHTFVYILHWIKNAIGFSLKDLFCKNIKFTWCVCHFISRIHKIANSWNLRFIQFNNSKQFCNFFFWH